MEQYIDLMSASATAGAQAVADTTLLLQAYLMGLAAIVGALIVAWCALTGLSYPEQSQRAMAARLWERVGEACAADRAGCWAAYRGSYRKSAESGQGEAE
jgi:hypothetical protein